MIDGLDEAFAAFGAEPESESGFGESGGGGSLGGLETVLVDFDGLGLRLLAIGLAEERTVAHRPTGSAGAAGAPEQLDHHQSGFVNCLKPFPAIERDHFGGSAENV